MDEPKFRMTASAGERVASIAAGQGCDPIMRLSVSAGGCSGFSYRFEMPCSREDGDLLLERGGATLLIDPVSLELLRGGELDWREALIGARFEVRNPNAASGCGCGSSFSVPG